MESSFQFTNPVLKNLTFNLNDNFNNQENKKEACKGNQLDADSNMSSEQHKRSAE